MALEVQSQVVPMDGTTVIYQFQNEVQLWVAGVSGFGLTYGSTSDYHDMDTASFKIANVSASGNSLSFQAQGILNSGNDDTIDASASNLVITVLAITGDSSNTSKIDMTTMVKGETATIETQGGSAMQMVFLANSSWSYGTDHWVMQIKAETSLQSQGTSLTVNADGLMQNEWGQTATCVVDAAAIYDASGDREYITYSQTFKNRDITGTISIKYDILKLPADTTGWKGTYLISNFNVFYPDKEDHHIAMFGAGGGPISGTNMITFDDTNQWIEFNTSIYMNATDDVQDGDSTVTCSFLFWKENS